MSRRGLIIRLLIFVPLFAYFGFGAVKKCQLERQMETEQAERDADLKAHTKTVPLGDGRTIEVIEMTPEQAAKYGYKPPEVGPAKTEPAKAPEEVKAPEPANAPEEAEAAN